MLTVGPSLLYPSCWVGFYDTTVCGHVAFKSILRLREGCENLQFCLVSCWQLPVMTMWRGKRRSCYGHAEGAERPGRAWLLLLPVVQSKTLLRAPSGLKDGGIDFSLGRAQYHGLGGESLALGLAEKGEHKPKAAAINACTPVGVM